MKNKIIVSILTIIMLCSFTLLGCEESVDSSGDAGQGESTPVQNNHHIDREQVNYQGVHENNSEELAGYLVKDGVSEYKVVIPEKTSSLIKRAVNEFNYFFNMATGCTLPVIDDNNKTHNPEEKYISIGRTSLLESCGRNVDNIELGQDGHEIFTKDQTIYIIGGSDFGSLFGVYTFMKDAFNFECYYYDTYDIDKNVKNIKLKDYHIKEVPDIAFRVLNYDVLTPSTGTYDMVNFGYRIGLCKDRGSNMMGIHKELDPASPCAASTNCEYYIPYKKYSNPDDAENYHPKWFSDSSNDTDQQWCYTARGDAEEYDKMVDLCAKKIEFSLSLYTPEECPEKNVVTITMQDNDNVCHCDACKAAAKKYGAESGAVVVFINAVAEKVSEWMNQPENAPYKRDDLKIIFFAYRSFQPSPTVFDEETKKWTPSSPEVVLRDDVGVYLAINTGFDYQQSVYAPTNQTGRQILESWSDISNNIFLWTYSTNFPNEMYMYDSVNFFNEEGYQYLCNKNTQFLVNQAQDTNRYSTAWHNLKLYLDAKLSWNSGLSTEELTQKWFKAMFSEAGSELKALYDEMRVYIRYTYEKNGQLTPGNNWLRINEAKYWELPVLENWLAKYDHAKLALEKYRLINPEYYAKCVNHIEFEALFPIYAILEIYNDTGLLTIEKSNELFDRFERDIAELGLEKMRYKETYESGYISELLEKRGK